MEVTVIFQRSRGVRGVPWGKSAEAEQEQSGKGGKHTLRAGWSGGWRSRVSEGTPQWVEVGEWSGSGHEVEQGFQDVTGPRKMQSPWIISRQSTSPSCNWKTQ
jgi:hypothetical protein